MAGSRLIMATLALILVCARVYVDISTIAIVVQWCSLFNVF